MENEMRNETHKEAKTRVSAWTGIIIVIVLLLIGLGWYLWSQRNVYKYDLGVPDSTTDQVMIQDEAITATETIPPTEAPYPKSSAETPMTIDTTKKYTATLHTSAGDVVVELNAAQTPVTVNNFVTLAKKGFYDNTIFHRTIKDFMIQGGDPKGDGTGGPGYSFNDEKFDGEYTRGTLAMANAGPNTNGSQFFIMHKDVALPKNYVIFGKVLQGLEVVDAIAAAPTSVSPMGEPSKPINPVVVKSVDIKEE